MVKTAGFQVRFIALFIDFIICTIGIGLVSLLLYGQFFVSDQHFITDYLGVLYSILLPVIWQGRTVGKHFYHICIMKTNGENVTLVTMLIRTIVGNLIYLLSFGVCFVISAFMVGMREDNRSIHDFIAGTYVTYK